MKAQIRKLTPGFVLSLYHYFLAWLGAFIYRYPSKELKVIGVTGTKGKSTVIYLAGKILEEAKQKVGWISSLSIKVAEREELNPFHLTMPGRFFIQKALRAMVKTGCQYALIEVTSEGIKQHRHKFISFDTALLTNLAAEHIEAHGSFKKYKEAKMKLFKSIHSGGKIILNFDDHQAIDFSKSEAKEKLGFGIKPVIKNQLMLQAKNNKIKENGICFEVNNIPFDLRLLGKFNLYNALAAVTIAFSEGFNLQLAKKALQKITKSEGRMEEIEKGQDFRIFVDLAHTPDSFEKVFKFVRALPHHKIIAVFGAAGGGRDKWKRPKLGEIAAEYADYLILTNEDPYDENEVKIIDDISAGILQKEKFEVILDRRKAISRALAKASASDVLLVLGKGTEATLVIGEDKQPWDDRKVVIEELGRMRSK